ncbi:MAG: type I phosphomannose isomerase catalytic subunit [Planctomycetaceae bacterium]
MDPLVFEPLLKRIRWGGRRLGDALGKPIGDADDYAESWEIADHGDDQSIVARGPLAGWTLSRLVRERGQELLGRHARAGLEQFPLLVKFLDAQDRLSVQVHPNDIQAKRFDPSENGKTEAWVVLEAAPHSLIYAGLRPDVDADSLRAHLAAGTVVECLHAFHPQPGDCLFVPAGTVHALGEGIMIAEVQQSSDITFRMFDWDRLDREGNARPLHIEESLAVIDFTRGPVNPVRPEIIADEPGRRTERLAHSEYFELRRHTLGTTLAISRSNECSILLALSGTADLHWDGESLPLPRGQSVLIPAESPDVRIEPRGEVTLLEAFLP